MFAPREGRINPRAEVFGLLNLAKYGQPARYHTYSAKAWGVSLFVATIALFGFGYGGLTLSVANEVVAFR